MLDFFVKLIIFLRYFLTAQAYWQKHKCVLIWQPSIYFYFRYSQGGRLWSILIPYIIACPYQYRSGEKYRQIVALKLLLLVNERMREETIRIRLACEIKSNLRKLLRFKMECLLNPYCLSNSAGLRGSKKLSCFCQNK